VFRNLIFLHHTNCYWSQMWLLAHK